jgi:hypothetical protein
MKIISKYKDYYDYLVGIYGVDEKLILDRTDFVLTSKLTNKSKVTFYICGYIIDGYYIDGKFYYGSDLEQFADEPVSGDGLMIMIFIILKMISLDIEL